MKNIFIFHNINILHNVNINILQSSKEEKMSSWVKAASLRMEKEDTLETNKKRKWTLERTESPENVKLINLGHILNEYQSSD